MSRVTLETNVAIGGKNMTEELERIAMKEDSEVRSIVAQLGLSTELKGTLIIQEFVLSKRKTKMLSDKEVNLVLRAWESRWYVPRALIASDKNDNVKLLREEGETEEAYKRRKVEHIEKYVKTILA